MSVIVVGSLNLDLVAEVAHLPARGETLLADGHGRALGGKGANQAVSAARHGVDVAMVGCVGADAEGRALTGALAAEGIDVSGIAVRDDVATGVAHITVDPEGANTIVVVPGANGRLGAADVRDELSRLPAADVVLVQLEIPVEAVMAAAETAAARVVLNPAPARELPRELLEQVDVLVPNAPELGALTGGGVPSTVRDVAARARLLAGGVRRGRHDGRVGRARRRRRGDHARPGAASRRHRHDGRRRRLLRQPGGRPRGRAVARRRRPRCRARRLAVDACAAVRSRRSRPPARSARC